MGLTAGAERTAIGGGGDGSTPSSWTRAEWCDGMHTGLISRRSRVRVPLPPLNLQGGIADVAGSPPKRSTDPIGVAPFCRSEPQEERAGLSPRPAHHCAGHMGRQPAFRLRAERPATATLKWDAPQTAPKPLAVCRLLAERAQIVSPRQCAIIRPGELTAPGGLSLEQLASSPAAARFAARGLVLM